MSIGEEDRLFLERERRYAESSSDESTWNVLDCDGCAAGELRHSPCLNKMRLFRLHEKANIREAAKVAEHIDAAPVDIGEMFK